MRGEFAEVGANTPDVDTQGRDHGRRAVRRFPGGVSSNHSKRNLEATLASLAAQELQIRDVELKLSKTLELNTTLTREVYELTKLIHAAVSASK